MFRYIKLLIFLLLLTALTLTACNIKLVKYGVAQGIGQLKVVMKAKPVKDYLNDPEFPDSLKAKLRLIQEIRKYAIDSLGVNDSRNYTTVYDQKGKPILWVITACEPYAFHPYVWHFPVVGSVGYKGFFNKKEAQKERDELIKKGYDTELGTVGGWSTLGWFKDPILTGMLNASEGAIAELIIHELTHATVYVKDSTDYNENLASFTGQKGAIKFLIHKYGLQSYELKEYQEDLADEDAYSRFILKGYQKLDSLYKSFSPQLKADIRDSLKFRAIAELKYSIDTVHFFDPRHFKRRIRKAEMNNAYFMSFRRYEGKQNIFEEKYQKVYQGNLRRFLQDLKSRQHES